MIVEELQGGVRGYFLMVLLEGAGDGQLHVARRVKARIHRILVVLHTLCDCFVVRIVSLKAHPLGREGIRDEAGFIHLLRDDLDDPQLIQLRAISIFALEL